MAPNPEAVKRAKSRYRERNRETLRRKGREYQERKRRAMGIPAQESAESSANRRRARKATGAEHPHWKGDEVGYFALHLWVKRHKAKTGTCSQCGKTPTVRNRNVGTEWANVSGEYLRELSDYIELCIPCHRVFDRQRKGLSVGS